MAPFLQDPGLGAIHSPPSSDSRPGVKSNGYISTNSTSLHTISPSPISHSGNIPSTDIYDLICVGFGPASLAIAIALHDATSRFSRTDRNLWRPRVCFLERQRSFGWHAGMLLPGAKMQISFIKDLATVRDPTSKFTFLNYLKSKNRLLQFANLGTFLPTRMEFEDYLRWCADHFVEDVEYGHEVTKITPGKSQRDWEKFDLFSIEAFDLWNEKTVTRRARHVVIAVGGRPHIPSPLPQQHARVIHSSSYLRRIPEVLESKDASYSIAVVGSGQSAAEIFNDLQTRYPNSRTTLIIKDSALRPSDDSPFVNEIFDPEHVDGFYHDSSDARLRTLESVRSTNYGVVRLELLEHIYQTLYQQRIQEPDDRVWQHRIMTSRQIVQADMHDGGGLRLTLQSLSSRNGNFRDHLEVDALIVATGYARDAHCDMLKEVAASLGASNSKKLRNSSADMESGNDREWHIGRDYKLELDRDLVSDDAGIWLQGSNEGTHGISDTLLSILATRSGEVVKSIFGDKLRCG